MDTEKQAIINMHRATRFESTTGSAGKLAEVEKAALAYHAKVIATAKQLRSENHLTEQAIGKQLAMIVIAWQSEYAAFEEIIAGVERAIRDESVSLPNRTEEHREICAHFKTLRGDERQVAIVRAITGKDEQLAAALATEPPTTSTLMDHDRAPIIKRLQPKAHAEEQQRATDLRSRVAATRATLHEVTMKLSGAL